ncbi:MAG: proton-conducting transporter membrane subunit [Candidatus Methanomethylophilaceae archaeon]|nr:proton-conducting transporter membrane subunit [Candidatus Methanomethylophilaceae archaeon]
MELFNVTLQNETLVAVFFAAILIPALAGIALGTVFRSAKIANVIAGLCIVSCAAGVFAYPLWRSGLSLSYALPVSSAVGDYALAIDQLSAVMISFSSVIFMLIVVHVVKSTSDSGCRYSGLLNALFLAVFSCMAADSVLVLLMSWEMITLVTFLLSKKGNNDRARWMFFVIAHIGGLVLICAYGYMAHIAGTSELSQWKGIGASISPVASMVLIMMIVMGFGTKLGLIPFHAWMPNLYATAPIHTAALLSTVCSNVAILVIFKSIFSYIGVQDSMSVVAFVIIGISAATALWGALESLVQKEPKKIMAYSSMENMALVVLCMALGMIFLNESPVFAKLILIAGLLHTLNHSVFKSLMLMTIDTVEDCTGEKNIGRTGGLAKALPALAAVSLVGVLSMADTSDQRLRKRVAHDPVHHGG